MVEIIRHYFKESSVPLMSGLPLPKDADGIVRNKRFIDCKFHPNCDVVQFRDCEFIVNGRSVSQSVALMH